MADATALRARVRDYLRDRVGWRDHPAATIPGGPSFAHALGWTIALLIGVELVTGVGLAMFYAPSTTDAWASVAYVQDQAALGWLVRGIHYHAASAIVIACGAHLLATLLRGGYRRPHELVWWLGIVLYALVLGWAVTGYVLRWDQAGYWANRVEIGIAAGTPGVGEQIRAVALGGNDYGNLTLTRFYALHALVLPALVIAVIAAHVALARRLGPAGHAPAGPDRVAGYTDPPRWPQQTIRNAVVMAAAFAALLAYVANQHGADLAAPADPSAAYDARPLWYFRWLFALRQLAGSWEKFAAMTAPAVVGGFFVALPLVDPNGNRRVWRGAACGVLALVLALTAASLAADSNDDALADRQAKDAARATLARELAVRYGVPVTGGLDVFATPPMWRARVLFAQRCKGCHGRGEKDRKGPIIAPGHGNREWLTRFLIEPGNDAYWGHTKLALTEDAMKPVELGKAELADVVEALYAESGAAGVDPAARARGKSIYDKACNDCHSLDASSSGTSAPSLGGLGSRDYYASFIANPKAATHMNGADRSQMPRFDAELSLVDRDALAAYLVWLRDATPAQLEALGPL